MKSTIAFRRDSKNVKKTAHLNNGVFFDLCAETA